LPRTLKICLGQEPESLYAYGTSSLAAESVLNAIYDGPFETRNHLSNPVILEKIPSVENGDVVLQPVDVKVGDVVVDADGNLVALAAGVKVFPYGCTSSECVIAWDGASLLQLNQIVVTYKLKPGLKWSDGQTLTAADVVFSYKLASDPDTPVSKDSIDQTVSYKALDDRSVQWVGKPGLVTLNLTHYFWLPLPQHVLGNIKPVDLLTAQESSQKPMGWGAYMIQDWQKGKYIRLAKNQNYLKSNEKLPKFDFLEFHFLGKGENPINSVENGSCDFVDSSAVDFENLKNVIENQNPQKFQTYITSSRELELVAFGIKPASYDDMYNPFGVDRPDFFGDARVRQAFAYCIDRQAIIKDLLSGTSKVPIGLWLPDDPILTGDRTATPFDPIKGNELLIAAGWLDYDKNLTTPRVAVGAKNIPTGMPLSFNFVTTDAGLRRQIAERIINSLAQCGIQVKPAFYPADEFYKPAPDGTIFGRKFDLAELAWQVEEESTCASFTSSETPTFSNSWLGKQTGGANYLGYNNPALDEACQVARKAGLNAQQYSVKKQEIAQIIIQDMPVIPLFFQPKMFLTRPDLCGFEPDSSSSSMLQQIENFDYGSGCPAE